MGRRGVLLSMKQPPAAAEDSVRRVTPSPQESVPLGHERNSVSARKAILFSSEDGNYSVSSRHDNASEQLDSKSVGRQLFKGSSKQDLHKKRSIKRSYKGWQSSLIAATSAPAAAKTLKKKQTKRKRNVAVKRQRNLAKQSWNALKSWDSLASLVSVSSPSEVSMKPLAMKEKKSSATAALEDAVLITQTDQDKEVSETGPQEPNTSGAKLPIPVDLVGILAPKGLRGTKKLPRSSEDVLKADEALRRKRNFTPRKLPSRTCKTAKNRSTYVEDSDDDLYFDSMVHMMREKSKPTDSKTIPDEVVANDDGDSEDSLQSSPTASVVSKPQEMLRRRSPRLGTKSESSASRRRSGARASGAKKGGAKKKATSGDRPTSRKRGRPKKQKETTKLRHVLMSESASVSKEVAEPTSTSTTQKNVSSKHTISTRGTNVRSGARNDAGIEATLESNPPIKKQTTPSRRSGRRILTGKSVLDSSPSPVPQQGSKEALFKQKRPNEHTDEVSIGTDHDERGPAAIEKPSSSPSRASRGRSSRSKPSQLEDSGAAPHKRDHYRKKKDGDYTISKKKKKAAYLESHSDTEGDSAVDDFNVNYLDDDGGDHEDAAPVDIVRKARNPSVQDQSEDEDEMHDGKPSQVIPPSPKRVMDKEHETRKQGTASSVASSKKLQTSKSTRVRFAPLPTTTTTFSVKIRVKTSTSPTKKGQKVQVTPPALSESAVQSIAQQITRACLEQNPAMQVNQQHHKQLESGHDEEADELHCEDGADSDSDSDTSNSDGNDAAMEDADANFIQHETEDRPDDSNNLRQEISFIQDSDGRSVASEITMDVDLRRMDLQSNQKPPKRQGRASGRHNHGRSSIDDGYLGHTEDEGVSSRHNRRKATDRWRSETPASSPPRKKRRRTLSGGDSLAGLSVASGGSSYAPLPRVLTEDSNTTSRSTSRRVTERSLKENDASAFESASYREKVSKSQPTDSRSTRETVDETVVTDRSVESRKSLWSLGTGKCGRCSACKLEFDCLTCTECIRRLQGGIAAASKGSTCLKRICKVLGKQSDIESLAAQKKDVDAGKANSMLQADEFSVSRLSEFGSMYSSASKKRRARMEKALGQKSSNRRRATGGSGASANASVSLMELGQQGSKRRSRKRSRMKETKSALHNLELPMPTDGSVASILEGKRSLRSLMDYDEADQDWL